MKPSSFTIFPHFFNRFSPTEQLPGPFPPPPAPDLRGASAAAGPRRRGARRSGPPPEGGWIHPNNVEVFARKNVEKCEKMVKNVKFMTFKPPRSGFCDLFWDVFHPKRRACEGGA